MQMEFYIALESSENIFSGMEKLYAVLDLLIMKGIFLSKKLE